MSVFLVKQSFSVGFLAGSQNVEQRDLKITDCFKQIVDLPRPYRLSVCRVGTYPEMGTKISLYMKQEHLTIS